MEDHGHHCVPALIRRSIKLIVNNQPIASGETRVHVIETTALEVSVTPSDVDEGTSFDLEVTRASTQNAFTKSAVTGLQQAGLRFKWDTGNKGLVEPVAPHTAVWKTAGMNAGTHGVVATLVDSNGVVLQGAAGPVVATGQGKIKPSALSKGDTLRVALQRSATVRTRDQVFWSLIRSSTTAIGSSNYSDFIARVLCPGPTDVIGRQSVLVSQLNRRAKELQPFTYGVGAYELLKTATQIFLLLECGGCHADIKDIDLDEESARLGETVTLQQLTDRLRVYLGSGHLPYIDRVLENAFRRSKGNHPTALFWGAQLQSSGAMPARADLVVLARRRDARADNRRRHQAVPEHARPGRSRSAGASRDRSAATAQQSPLGIRAGRVESADGEAAGLRIRSSLRPDDPRQGSAASPEGGQPIEVPGRLPPPSARHVELLQGRQRHDGDRRRLPAAQCT